MFDLSRTDAQEKMSLSKENHRECVKEIKLLQSKLAEAQFDLREAKNVLEEIRSGRKKKKYRLKF